MPQILKYVALDKFVEKPNLKSHIFCAGKALYAAKQGCLNITLHCIGPKMEFGHFSNFFTKKFLGLTKKKSCTFLYTFGGYNFPKSCGKTS